MTKMAECYDVENDAKLIADPTFQEALRIMTLQIELMKTHMETIKACYTTVMLVRKGSGIHIG